MYELIQQSIAKLESKLTLAEIKDLLENDQSFLCSEYCPHPSDLQILDPFSDDVLLAVGDIVNDFWIALLRERYTKQCNHQNNPQQILCLSIDNVDFRQAVKIPTDQIIDGEIQSDFSTTAILDFIELYTDHLSEVVATMPCLIHDKHCKVTSALRDIDAYSQFVHEYRNQKINADDLLQACNQEIYLNISMNVLEI